MSLINYTIIEDKNDVYEILLSPHDYEKALSSYNYWRELL